MVKFRTGMSWKQVFQFVVNCSPGLDLLWCVFHSRYFLPAEKRNLIIMDVPLISYVSGRYYIGVYIFSYLSKNPKKNFTTIYYFEDSIQGGGGKEYTNFCKLALFRNVSSIKRFMIYQKCSFYQA